MANERIEQKIEEHLIDQLEKDLNEDQIRLLETKVSTIRKLSAS